MRRAYILEQGYLFLGLISRYLLQTVYQLLNYPEKGQTI